MTALARLYLVVLVVDIVTHLRVRRFVVLQAADSKQRSFCFANFKKKREGRCQKVPKFLRSKSCVVHRLCTIFLVTVSQNYLRSQVGAFSSYPCASLLSTAPFRLHFFAPLFLFPPFLESESVQAQRGENWVTHYCTGERGEEEGEGRRLRRWGLIAITQKALWALGAPNPCPKVR